MILKKLKLKTETVKQQRAGAIGFRIYGSILESLYCVVLQGYLNYNR